MYVCVCERLRQSPILPLFDPRVCQLLVFSLGPLFVLLGGDLRGKVHVLCGLWTGCLYFGLSSLRCKLTKSFSRLGVQCSSDGAIITEPSMSCRHGAEVMNIDAFVSVQWFVCDQGCVCGCMRGSVLASSDAFVDVGSLHEDEIMRV